jgi:hypothetical protein
LYPTRGDRKEQDREKLPFTGDAEHKPPLGWVIQWRGRYHNWYGPCIAEALKGWGYVFWDSGRLKREKLTGVVARERDSFEQAVIFRAVS